MPRIALLTLLVFGFLAADFARGESPVGFRTDGTGRYPAATPPLEWGPDKNVVWHLRLPQGNAVPVILGKKLFTCAEPCVLVCVNKGDGKVLWQKESSYKELVLTEKEKTQFEAERKQDGELARQQSRLEKEGAALRKAIKDDPSTKVENETKLKDLKVQIDRLRAQRKLLTTYNRYLEPGKGAGGYHPTGGYSSATPVTNGKHVYVIFGNGLAACYDLDGNRKWLRLIEHPTAAYGHGASPLLVKDRLLVHFSDLVALDVRDGSEVWRVKIPPSHGTPMHARIGETDVAIHPQGQVIRISDGTVLAKNLGSTGPNSPLVQDGKVFFVAGQVRGYELPKKDASEKWTPLWKGTSIKGGGYWFPSPVLHDGLIYALNASANFTVIDAKTGSIVYARRLSLGGGQSYPSISLAGNHLYVSSDNGTTVVLRPGRQYKELARNSLEAFRSSLVFEGKRMYVRTTRGLWCIGE
jgi:hypothetical protein